MVSPISVAGGTGLKLPALTLTVNASLAMDSSHKYSQTQLLVYLLGVPIIDSATNGGLNPMQSPFTSCPATTASYAYVNNFNICGT